MKSTARQFLTTVLKVLVYHIMEFVVYSNLKRLGCSATLTSLDFVTWLNEEKQGGNTGLIENT